VTVTGLLSNSGKVLAGLLAVAAVALLPPESRAAGITFRNDLKTPVFIQGASVVNRMFLRSQPILILPGRSALDPQLPPGKRWITIYDANQRNRILHQSVIPFTGQSLRLRVHLSPAGTVTLTPDDEHP
jgi:hypothetical protein